MRTFCWYILVNSGGINGLDLIRLLICASFLMRNLSALWRRLVVCWQLVMVVTSTRMPLILLLELLLLDTVNVDLNLSLVRTASFRTRFGMLIASDCVLRSVVWQLFVTREVRVARMCRLRLRWCLIDVRLRSVSVLVLLLCCSVSIVLSMVIAYGLALVTGLEVTTVVVRVLLLVSSDSCNCRWSSSG